MNDNYIRKIINICQKKSIKILLLIIIVEDLFICYIKEYELLKILIFITFVFILLTKNNASIWVFY